MKQVLSDERRSAAARIAQNQLRGGPIARVLINFDTEGGSTLAEHRRTKRAENHAGIAACGAATCPIVHVWIHGEQAWGIRRSIEFPCKDNDRSKQHKNRRTRSVFGQIAGKYSDFC
jgi:hypothetical protein